MLHKLFGLCLTGDSALHTCFVDALLDLSAVDLQSLPAGYLESPATSSEERHVLYKLFGLCLTGEAALHTCLVDALLDLSAVEAECRGVGTAASLGREQPSLANVVAEAICGIKIQVKLHTSPHHCLLAPIRLSGQATHIFCQHQMHLSLRLTSAQYFVSGYT